MEKGAFYVTYCKDDGVCGGRFGGGAGGLVAVLVIVLVL